MGNPVDQLIQKEFEANRRILTFEEYLLLLSEQPQLHTRGSAQYILDMIDYYGQTHEEGEPTRYKVFDFPTDGKTIGVIGHEPVQQQIYKVLRSFARQKINNKLILLHGPNGSAKSSIIRSLLGGLERYSNEPVGAFYSFNWVFPVEKYTRGEIGLQSYGTRKDQLSSYAKLPTEEMGAKVCCELKDHPLLLIPREHRVSYLETLIGKDKTQELTTGMPEYLLQGDLCHRCKLIYESLLSTHNGDPTKVLKHIQVERLYFSRRYRKGLVTIEPQMHVDAQFQQISYSKGLSALPPALQSLNLFVLAGDLVDGNRGVVEFSDLLKKPVESFKYLLGACETGSVNIGFSIAYLDTFFIGSTNEVQLDAFKEFPDFTSFKARFELIRVPYLLSVRKEEKIYAPQLKQMAGEKHVAPHVAWTASLWAILTRLKKPNSVNYPPQLSNLVSNLGPLEKAKFYDSGELPESLSLEDRKLLRASILKIVNEYSNIPYYEGRMGASAREIKTILLGAAQNLDYPCLSPLAVLRELEEFVKHVSEYDFLKQEVKEGYHDSTEFIKRVRTEYLSRIDMEVRECVGIYDTHQWEDFLKKYVQHVSLVLKKEKLKNSITGQLEDPDLSLIQEFEKIVEAPSEEKEKEAFRQNIISQIGVWSLDHPKERVNYSKVFPEFWRKLEKYYFESQRSLLKKMSDAILVYDTEKHDSTSEGGTLALQTIENMQNRLGYCKMCAKEVISFLMQQRYQ